MIHRHRKFDVPKKLKRLIIWNGESRNQQVLQFGKHECSKCKLTWRTSWQISTERKLLLKKTSVVRDNSTGKTWSHGFLLSSLWTINSPNFLFCLESRLIFKELFFTDWHEWNSTRTDNPQRNWNSLLSNLTIQCPDINVCSSKFLGLFSSNSTGAASRAVAWRINNQTSSRYLCTLDETNNDWIPSRNGLYCKRG